MAKNSFIGLDIEDSEIFMASGGRVTYMQMPEGLIKDSKIVSPESLSNFIKTVKKEGSIPNKNVVLILPSEATFFRIVNSPVVSDAQLKLNLPYEFKDFIGNNSIEYNYDYAVSSYEKDDEGKVTSIKLLAAAANKKVVEEYYSIIKRANLKLKVALPREMALINVMKNAQEGKEYCFLSIGYLQSNVYIFNGSRLTATKMIEIGCKDIDMEIATNLNIDMYLAASYRNTNHNDVLSSPFLNTIYEKIAHEIRKTINFYKYENHESELSDIYFFNVGSKLKPLKKNISDSISFTEKDVRELLPSEYQDNEEADRCLLSIGALL